MSKAFSVALAAGAIVLGCNSAWSAVLDEPQLQVWELQAVSAQIANPADAQRAAGQEATTRPLPAVSAPRLRSWEMPAIVVEGEAPTQLREEDKVGSYGNRAPVYPPEARRRKLEGVVYLTLKLNEHGAVTAVEINKSSGIDSFDRSAMEAAVTWTFSPMRVEGVAQACELTVPVSFVLKKR